MRRQPQHKPFASAVLCLLRCQVDSSSVPAAFNLDLIATGAATAWLDALAAVQERFAAPAGGAHRPCHSLYAALPDIVELPEDPGQLGAYAWLAAKLAKKARSASASCSALPVKIESCKFAEVVLSFLASDLLAFDRMLQLHVSSV